MFDVLEIFGTFFMFCPPPPSPHHPILPPAPDVQLTDAGHEKTKKNISKHKTTMPRDTYDQYKSILEKIRFWCFGDFLGLFPCFWAPFPLRALPDPARDIGRLLGSQV